MSDVLALFVVDPLPPLTMERLYCDTRAAAAIIYRPQDAGREIDAMVDGVLSMGVALDGSQAAYWPARDTCGVVITTNRSPQLIAAGMALGLNVPVDSVLLPSRFVPNEWRGMEQVVKAIYQWRSGGAQGENGKHLLTTK